MTNPGEIRLPTPCVVVLVGAAGSGKSTFAARWFTPDEILSSDAFRERLTGDAGDQRATGAAFAALHAALACRLRERRPTVVDATNVTARARLALLARAQTAGVPAIAIVLDLPAAVVHARNASRAERVVPASVVERHVGQLQQALAGGGTALANEGFADVIRFTDTAALDAARVTRG
jgi:protein phosphatase